MLVAHTFLQSNFMLRAEFVLPRIAETHLFWPSCIVCVFIVTDTYETGEPQGDSSIFNLHKNIGFPRENIKEQPTNPWAAV